MSRFIAASRGRSGRLPVQTTAQEASPPPKKKIKLSHLCVLPKEIKRASDEESVCVADEGMYSVLG